MDKYIHVPIKDLLSNPFRRIEHYPIRREKVEALKESIEKTGFWDNLLVRPAKNGKFERAFGEHRATALKEYFDEHPKEDRKVGVIVREISDEDMIRIMARENMEEWGKTSGLVELETVHSVVLAYAEGKIDLNAHDPKAPSHSIRYAPAFTMSAPQRSDIPLRPYTSASVAQFLNWNGDKIKDLLTGLQFITDPENDLSYNDFADLSISSTRAVIESARAKYLKRISTAKAAEVEAVKAAKEAEAAEKKIAKAKNAEEKESARQNLVSARKMEAAHKEVARTYRTRAQEAVTKVGRGVSQAIRSGERGYMEAADIADEIIHDRPKERELMQLEKFIKKVGSSLYEVLRPDFDSRTERLDAIIQATKDRSVEIEPRKIQSLALTLVNLSKRAMAYADQLSPTGNAVKFVFGMKDSLQLEDVK